MSSLTEVGPKHSTTFHSGRKLFQDHNLYSIGCSTLTCCQYSCQWGLSLVFKREFIKRCFKNLQCAVHKSERSRLKLDSQRISLKPTTNSLDQSALWSPRDVSYEGPHGDGRNGALADAVPLLAKPAYSRDPPASLRWPRSAWLMKYMRLKAIMRHDLILRNSNSIADRRRHRYAESEAWPKRAEVRGCTAMRR